MDFSGSDEDVVDTVAGKAIVKRHFSLKPFNV
jgi:hypothetical protein